MTQLDNLNDVQADLEHKALAMGMNKYRKALTISGQAENGVGQRLMAAVIEPLAVSIDEWMHPVGKRGPKARQISLVEGISPQAMAVLTLKSALSTTSNTTKTTALSRTIGQLIFEHRDWVRMESEDKGLAVKVGKQLKYTSSESHRRAVVRHVTKATLGWQPAAQKDTAEVGRIMLGLMCNVTGLYETVNVYEKSKRKTVSYVRATERAVKFLEEGNARNELLMPVSAPMVCKPAPWTNPYDGGYLKHRNTVVKTPRADYLRDLASDDLSDMYRALNALQDTAYSVNTGVLEVMKEAHAAGDTFAGLPQVDETPLPAKPLDIETNDESLTAWKAEAAAIHSDNARLVTKRMSFMRVLALGEQYAHYDALYFPHNLDWRGRAYPLPIDLQPQGDDIAKGLLQLAEAVPLGEYGANWLMIHIANLFGEDKVSMDDRVDWVMDNAAKLLDSAFSPLDGDRYWCTADKPWQALAACKDFAGWYVNGDDHKSHLIIAVDGSCNGLQNLSAMLLDEEGGSAVNLLPNEKPSDIYQMVANRANEMLDDSEDPMAQQWIEEGEGGVSRGMAKRPVMTKPYGSTLRGMRGQITKQMVKDKLFTDVPFMERSALAGFLAGIIETAIGEIVIASKDVMDWMKGVAKVAASDGSPLHWTTPIGLNVLQDYRVYASEKSEVYVGGQKFKFKLAEPTELLNKSKQQAGMSPNVIHSLDASHMMLSVLGGLDAGLDAFAMVHDSYGTHAGRVNELNILLRKAFVDMYRNPVLVDLNNQFVRQLDPAVAAELPELPEMGSLEIDKVLESMYFFA